MSSFRTANRTKLILSSQALDYVSPIEAYFNIDENKSPFKNKLILFMQSQQE